jgi:hypothetical protein
MCLSKPVKCRASSAIINPSNDCIIEKMLKTEETAKMKNGKIYNKHDFWEGNFETCLACRETNMTSKDLAWCVRTIALGTAVHNRRETLIRLWCQRTGSRWQVPRHDDLYLQGLRVEYHVHTYPQKSKCASRLLVRTRSSSHTRHAQVSV